MPRRMKETLRSSFIDPVSLQRVRFPLIVHGDSQSCYCNRSITIDENWDSFSLLGTCCRSQKLFVIQLGNGIVLLLSLWY